MKFLETNYIFVTIFKKYTLIRMRLNVEFGLIHKSSLSEMFKKLRGK